MAKTSSTQRPAFRGPREFTPLHILLGVCAVLAVIVMAAAALVPRKPPAPPPSRVTYPAAAEARVDGVVESFAAVDPYEAPERDPKDVAAQEEYWQKQSGKPGDLIEVYGAVTEEGTGEPVRDATIICARQWTQEEFDRWQADTIGAGRAEADMVEVDSINIEVLADGMTADPGPSAPAEEGAAAGPEDQSVEEKLDSKRRARTDREGRYRFTVTIPGEFSISANHDGFLYKEIKKTVAEGQTKVRVDFALSRGARISGRVTERGSGRGAAGVIVGASTTQAMPEEYRNDAYAHTRTDGEGHYTVSGLPPGEFQVQLEIMDRPYQFAGLPPVRLVALKSLADEARNVDFVVDAAGTVWGYVLDPDGHPVQGCDLVQCNSDSVVSQVIEAAMRMRPPVHASTNREGFYKMVGVPLNRECRVYVFAGEHAPQLSEPFVLTETRREAQVDVYLKGGTTIYGRVIDTRDRTLVPAANVVCMPGVAKLTTPFDAPAGFRDTRTDASGTFTLPHLPAGQHRLFATKDGYKLSLAGEPIFSDGHHDLMVDLWLTPVDSGDFTVYGQVTNTANQPIAGAGVELGAMAFDSISGGRQTQTDPQGRYLFTGVDAAMLVLNVRADGYAAKTVGDVRLDGPTNVTLEAQGGVRGRVVVRETGRAPESCTVRAFPALVFDGGFPEAFGGGSTGTEASGAFSMDLPAGTYTLVAVAPGLVPGRAAATVEAGKVTRNVVIAMTEAGGAIRGRVTTSDGKSPAGATVQLGRGGASFAGLMPLFEEGELRPQSVGDDGRFEFKGLAPGEYRLAATLMDYAQAVAGPIALEEGKTINNVELVLGAGGILRGTVTIAGQLAPGAVVTVVGNGITRVTTADRNGQYILEHVPAGAYLATAVSPEALASGSFAPAHGQVEIREGQTTVFNFGEQGGATIEGLCTPPPPTGKMAFAVLRVAGAGPDVASLDLRNMLAWFASGDIESAAAYIVGFAQVDRDGYFRIDNAPQGEYVLDVLYVDVASFISRGGQQAYSAPVTVADSQPIQLQIGM